MTTKGLYAHARLYMQVSNIVEEVSPKIESFRDDLNRLAGRV